MFCTGGKQLHGGQCGQVSLAATDAPHYTPGTAAFRAFGPASKFAAAAALVANIFGCAGCAGRSLIARIKGLLGWGDHVCLAME
jgi:predicted metal-binding protein